MIVIPDLFGSYQKGREAAIEANWKDLSNYESIESARHQNDAQALANLATMADFGKKRQMVSNDAATSDLNLQLLTAQQPAKLNIAKGDEFTTGIQLGTLLANEDAVKQGYADGLFTWVTNANTGTKNARVANDKATIGADVSAATYPYLRQSAFNKTMSDIAVQDTASKWNPLIAGLTYPTQYLTAGIAYDTAQVDKGHAKALAKGRNQQALSGYEAGTAGNKLTYLKTTADIAGLPYTLTEAANSRIAMIYESMKGLDPNSGEYKMKEAAINNIIKGAGVSVGAIGYDGISASYFAPTPPSATSQGTGSTTYVDPSTGRAITVPYATTGVGPLASGYVPYGSNGTNLFTGSSQPRTLSEITANLTTPRQNVMGVPNIGNVPNSALVKTARHNLPNGQVWYTTAPVRQVQPMPSQGQVTKNFNNRRGIL